MPKRVPTALVVIYALCGALALIGCEFAGSTCAPAKTAPWWVLKFVFKPLTTLLLFPMLGRPHERFQKVIAVGVFFSLVGDVALLWPGSAAFGVGLAAFLAAHVSYIIAFTGVGRWSPRVVMVAVVMVVATGILLALNIPKVDGILPSPPLTLALKLAVAIYGTALATMVTSAWSTLDGRVNWALPAALGGILFYIGDSSLALDAFYFKPCGIPHAWLLTIGVYWLGQLGIVLAARSGSTPPGGGPQAQPTS